MAVSSLEYSSQFDHTPFYGSHLGIKRQAREQMVLFSGIIMLSAFRRHMKDPAGNWIVEPPSYEAIVSDDKTVHTSNEYTEIGAENISTNVGAELINDVFNKKLGVVMNENQLEEFFSQVSR
ncbi:hypothetical protein Ddye_009075 [Dipteronia dyeriana]|uniref:Protein N-terminal glutamine amidohydrolase n=1 Tax=Dipteronia dyeriana TaxID=168575 RepID=A0AAE0CMJ5_9ROSI|nr:hypothetical protein Ddye_009075 [Dipteronia dyeriana]